MRSVTFSLRLVADQEARALLDRPDFVSAWNRLAAGDGKFTAIQEPAFVVTWYTTYWAEYAPVLCLAYGPANELRGLMPIARHRASGAICHAGAGQAEYHGWICDAEIEDEFPLACLIEVGRRLRPTVWRWRWMPPGASTAWLADRRLADAGIHVRSIQRPSYVIDLHDEAHLAGLRRRHSLKNNIRRHQRTPGFRLERMTRKADTDAVIDRIAAQYDLRAAGAYGAAGFRGDPHKRSFFVERQNHPDALHYAVLWSRNDVLAFNLGACDHSRVLLGVFGFNPIEARTSPGTILIVELAKALKEQGFRYLDLTPGRQPFKAQLANRHEDLVLPTFCFTRRARVAARFDGASRRAARLLLRGVGINDPHARQRLVGRIGALRRIVTRLTPSAVSQRLARIVYRRVEYCYYRHDGSAIHTGHTAAGVQRYADLLAYSGSNRRLPYGAFLQRSLRRLAAGDVLYSVVRDGVLAHYGWLQKMSEAHVLSGFSSRLNVPAGSVILCDFYTEPRFQRQGLYTHTLGQMLNDCRAAGITDVFIGVNARNAASRRVVEKVGFVPYRRFTRTWILGWQWERVVSPPPAPAIGKRAA
jgi:CelD/BcsL family acetyltransferase involved in cellulose biosynthesis/GNAT superfamily N-acetyltransferase